jgi:hypothetical protein
MRRRKRRQSGQRLAIAATTSVGLLDLLSDTLAQDRTFRVLTIIDEYTREYLAIEANTSLPGFGSSSPSAARRQWHAGRNSR